MKRVVIRIIAAIMIASSIVVAAIPTEKLSADETKSVPSEFQIDGNKLIKYTGTASTVSVPDTIKYIGEEAFSDNAYVKRVIIPSSVKEICYAAFTGCNNIEEVIIPDSVEEIGSAAFSNCSLLSKITIGSGLKKMGSGVFVGCSKLSTINFKGNENFVCKDGVVYDDEYKRIYQVLQGREDNKFVMPNSVKEVLPYSFYGCKNINSIELSNNLSEIQPYSFSNCNGLTSVNIPYSVNLIDIKAFENCVNLRDVNMSVAVSYIAPSAFDGCGRLNIIAPDYSYAKEWFKNFDSSNVNIIDKEDNNEVVKPSEDETNIDVDIDPYLAQAIVVARQAVFFIDNTALTVKNGSLDKEIVDIDELIKAETHGKGLHLPKFAVLGNKISGKAFYGDTKLKEYKFPENITEIGDFAFARSSLKEIVIPDTVTHIGYGAFYHCDDLSVITVPSSVTDIETSAFDKTRMYENWLLYGSSDFLILGDGILVSYKGKDKVVNIPDNVKQIGPEAFKNNKYIEEVYLPDGLKRICEEAFYGCEKLKRFSGGTALEKIEDRAFYACPLETVRIVDSVVSIGLGAFNITKTGLTNDYKVAVFHGNNLPKVTYDKTATRLTNEDYRVHSLEGVKVAVINNETVLRTGTVLDRNESGFSGLICTISEPNTSYFNGTIKILDCTMTADEASSVYIPKTVYIYGKGYNFLEDELSNVLEMARRGEFEATVESDSNPHVKFPGSSTEYSLKIDSLSEQSSSLKDAYYRIYSDNLPKNTVGLNISLKELTNDVLLTKFGKQELNISLPLPPEVSSKNLHVICIDEYNQLEDLAYDILVKEDKLYLEFNINHTGEYAVYSYTSDSIPSLMGLDESPDTGDYINPKWFLSIGLLSLGIALFFVKFKK